MSCEFVFRYVVKSVRDRCGSFEFDTLNGEDATRSKAYDSNFDGNTVHAKYAIGAAINAPQNNTISQYKRSQARMR